MGKPLIQGIALIFSRAFGSRLVSQFVETPMSSELSLSRGRMPKPCVIETTPRRSVGSAVARARIAFAVAAHLKTDILFLDEILAVGDGAFKKKCFSKIQDNQIQKLLNRLVLLLQLLQNVFVKWKILE